MHKYYFDGKTKSEAIERALSELKITEENLIVNVVEEKNSLLKKNVKIEVLNLNDIIAYIKETLVEITKLMNISINLEVRRRENSINIKMFSDNNSILIGKNGRTILSLQNIIKQMVYVQTGNNVSIVLDVENYKENRGKSIEYLAKKLAQEVLETNVEVRMDNMNSYERRLVHSVLSKNEFVYTESTGEEPNRCVVIKPKQKV